MEKLDTRVGSSDSPAAKANYGVLRIIISLIDITSAISSR